MFRLSMHMFAGFTYTRQRLFEVASDCCMV